jgi:PAS domain S-box-containing protein
MALNDRQAAAVEAAPSASDGAARLLLDGLPALIRMTGADHACSFCNRTWLIFTGRALERELGNGWCEGVHKDDYVRYQVVYHQAFAARQPFEVLYRLRHLSGEYRWLLERAVPLYRGDGSFAGYSASCSEVTQGEDALHGLWSLQRAILDSSAYLIVATDASGVIRVFNPAAEKLLGYRKEEVVGKATLMIFYDPSEIQRCADELTQVLNHTVRPAFEVLILKAQLGRAKNREWTLVRKDGSRFPAEVSATLLRDAGESMSGFLTIAGDISERRRADDLLACQKGILEAIALGWPLQDSLQMIAEAVEKQLSGVYCTILPAGEKGELFCGVAADQSSCRFSADGAACSPGARLCHKADQESRSFMISDIATDPLCAHVRGPALGRGLRGCWSHPIAAQDGQLLGLLAVYQGDVREPGVLQLEAIRTAARLASLAIERHRAEQQLKDRADALARLNEELSRSNADLSAFAYSASHDLKEPLRGIHNYAQFLLEDYASIMDAEGISKLATLTRLSQRMEALIDALLHYSRIGRQALILRETSLQTIVQETLEMLTVLIQESGVEIRVPRPLPTLSVDRACIGEVFANLIANAVKYNDQTQKWVEIGYREPGTEHPASGGARTWRFYVRDNGIGIPEKHHASVFRIFKRLHGRDRYGGGTGAGLTIVKKIIERHGGRIWVDSAPGAGSTFWFTLRDGGGNAHSG